MSTFPKLEVRELQPDDKMPFDELVTITLAESLGDMVPRMDLEVWASQYWAQNVTGECYVAHVGGVLAGYAVASRNSLKRTSICGGLERLYVRRADASANTFSNALPDRQVAAALVGMFAADKPSPLPVTAEQGNTALELYDRWGFVDIDALRLCLSSPSGHGRPALR
jgi:hypothetical protein